MTGRRLTVEAWLAVAAAALVACLIALFVVLAALGDVGSKDHRSSPAVPATSA